MTKNSSWFGIASASSRVLWCSGLLLLLFVSSNLSAKASPHEQFWQWLNASKDELKKAGKFSNENEFRSNGYFRAISTRLKTLNPNLSGYLFHKSADEYVLHLSSEGDLAAIEHIKLLQKTQPRNHWSSIQTLFEPTEYSNRAVHLTYPNVVYSDDVRFTLTPAAQKLNLDIYIPKDAIVDQDSIDGFAGIGLRGFVSNLMGEIAINRHINEFNLYEVDKSPDDAQALTKLNAELAKL